MKYTIFKYAQLAVLASLILALPACQKNFTDPNNATQEDVFKSTRGITGVAIGLQRLYTAGRASNLYNRVTLDGFITNQFFIVNRGNVAEDQLDRGGANVDGTNAILASLWTGCNKIIYDADNVITAAGGLGDRAYASGLIAYATLFKALAIGDMAMFWEQVPAGIGQNIGFIARAQGFAKAIADIDAALAAISANPISSSFTSAIPGGIDLPNALRAVKARYQLYTGQYAQALATAATVSTTVKSVFTFNAVNVNPVFETATATNNVYQPIDSTMGLPVGIQPDLADRRVPFYISLAATAPRFRINGFARANLTEWPIYTPGEMLLLRAECLARQATPDIAGALALVNQVVTKKAADDIYGVGAELPALTGTPTQAALLTEIYKQRCIELYMSGLKLEDMRRFGRPNSERRRNLMPYPFRERDNNTNTPPDPSF